MKLNIKFILSVIFLGAIYISLSACGKAYFDDEYEFFKGQQNKVTRDPISYVKVCSDYFAKVEYVEALAGQYCSKTNTVPVFVKKRYFADCSLLSPVDYVYDCQELPKEKV